MDNSTTGSRAKLTDATGHVRGNALKDTLAGELTCSEDDDSCDEEQSEDSDDDSQDESDCDTGRRR